MNRESGEDEAVQAEPCLPFLKWPGGKRWLAPVIAEIVGDIDGTYYEPFVGGGAVFFHLRPRDAVLSDSNTKLIEVYQQVQKNVDAVIEGMKGLRKGRALFDRIRHDKPRSALARTIRFLYLNRTSFNGMYRVNQRGEFNVPYGCKPGTVICDRRLLRAAAAALQSASVVSGDFAAIIRGARRGDVLYCDPPFTVKHDNNGFIRYNESLFSWEDQIRLADACRAAARRGARVIVSNAHHESIRELYKGFKAVVVTRRSLISGTPKGRGAVAEYVFLSMNTWRTEAV